MARMILEVRSTNGERKRVISTVLRVIIEKLLVENLRKVIMGKEDKWRE